MDDITTKPLRRIEKRHLVSPGGFIDWNPAHAIALEHMLAVIRKHFERAGFSPLHTPLVERTEVLAAKASGEISTQIYGLRLLNPDPNSPTDGKDLGIRFDHTVPLARFVAANQGSLQFPFRRYAIGPVVRGEKPKEGRYREFIQADIDTIGDGELSLHNDAEMAAIINAIFTELNFGPFTIRINNRKILMGFLESIGCDTPKSALAARRAIDNVDKLGWDRTVLALGEIGITTKAAHEALELLTSDDGHALMRSRKFGPKFAEGIHELEEVIDTMRHFGVPERRYRIDLSVARGLDYYTGTVYEARLDEHPALGSIAGGGRFENLADVFSSRHLPGVGMSIGVTRLLQRLIRDGLVKAESQSVAPVLLASRDINGEKEMHLSRAILLREAGIPTEVYLEPRELGPQIKFAVKRGIRLVIFTDEANGQTEKKVVVRDVNSGEQVRVHEGELLETVHRLL